MRRRLVVVAVVALAVSAAAAGLVAWIHHQNQLAWVQTLDRDRSSIDADTASARATPATGDDPAKFVGYCRSDVATYNRDAADAGGDLPDGYARHLNPDTECKAKP